MNIANTNIETSELTIHSRPWDVRFDAGRNARAKIGFVLIPNEQTIEEDMTKIAPPGVGTYFSRATMPHEISTEALEKLGNSLADTAGRILPDDKLDVICFACTSGTVAVGEDKAKAELVRGARGAIPTTLMTSVKEALKLFKANNIVVGTPYCDELNTNVANYLIQAGFNIVDFQGLNLNFDHEMIKVEPDYLIEFGRAIDNQKADALLISCGALRSLDIVNELEKQLGKPVVVSNQAMIWHCLRLAGINDKIDGYGDLLRRF